MRNGGDHADIDDSDDDGGSDFHGSMLATMDVASGPCPAPSFAPCICFLLVPFTTYIQIVAMILIGSDGVGDSWFLMGLLVFMPLLMDLRVHVAHDATQWHHMLVGGRAFG